jgi:hypothetical protein
MGQCGALRFAQRRDRFLEELMQIEAARRVLRVVPAE